MNTDLALSLTNADFNALLKTMPAGYKERELDQAMRSFKQRKRKAAKLGQTIEKIFFKAKVEELTDAQLVALAAVINTFEPKPA